MDDVQMDRGEAVFMGLFSDEMKCFTYGQRQFTYMLSIDNINYIEKT